MIEHNPAGAQPEQPRAQEPQRERLPDANRPRVWIGSLSDYTNGILLGDWMPADVDQADLIDQIHAMLARSEEQPAEEWMIFDDDNFGSYRVGEWEDLDTLTRVARGIARHGPAYAALAELHRDDLDILDQFDERFLGAYDSREAWAQQVVDDFQIEEMIQTLNMPDWLRSHIRIDLTGIARDLELSGDVTIEDNPDGGIWIFDERA